MMLVVGLEGIIAIIVATPSFLLFSLSDNNQSIPSDNENGPLSASSTYIRCTAHKLSY